MTSFLRSVVTFGNRENVVKETLISVLSESVKEVQWEYSQDENIRLDAQNESSNSLCVCLEAMFIHGLKNTFLNKVSRALGSDPDQRPEPSFWGPLLIFSHREIIDQISALSFITTDVGRCRVWLRLALNECLLSRYMEAMRQDGSALKPYYQRSAFIRDSELLDVAQQLIEGVEGCHFQLPCNSSLLNVWTNQPLLLAGIWTPPMRTAPVVSGVDVASTLDNLPQNEQLLSENSVPPCSLQGTGIGKVLPLNEDEALKIILGTPVDDLQRIPAESSNTEDVSVIEVKGNDPILHDGPNIAIKQREGQTVEVTDDGPSSVGNSLIGRVGWSSPFEEVIESSPGSPWNSENSSVSTQAVTPQNINNVQLSKSKLLRSPSDGQSYHALFESYTTHNVKTPDLREVLQRFEGADNNRCNNVADDGNDQFRPLYEMGYEVVPTSPTTLFNIPEFGNLVSQLGILPREPGLDSQNYACNSCGHPIGINFGPTRVCSFDGHYYCTDCHAADEWIIPARVIHNWDFRRYPVSKKSAAFLNEIQHHPLLDLKVLNPRLYLAVEEMAHLQTLRIQMNFLRAYLFTCREPVIGCLQKRVWPREYLYEHVHLYSVSDILQIPSGALAHMLQRVVTFGRDHVLNCWLCSQKGFICEVCNSPKVIYPFDVEATFRCAMCSAVFHVGCLNATKPCPKCERRQKREELPLLEVDP